MRLCAVRFIKVTFTHILAENQSGVCDLRTTCILLHYSVLFFSMGEVYASLIKSVSHSGGFYSVVEGGGELGGRGWERGREIVPDLTFLSDSCTRCVSGSAVPLRCCLLHSKPAVSQDYPQNASGEVVSAFAFQTISLAMRYLFRFFLLLQFFFN